MKLKNPFLTRGYAGGEYFCDRESELKKVIAAIENDRDITLIAPRRFGKSGLAGASSVAFAMRDLKERDLVHETDKGWIVYDRLFGEWLHAK